MNKTKNDYTVRTTQPNKTIIVKKRFINVDKSIKKINNQIFNRVKIL